MAQLQVFKLHNISKVIKSQHTQFEKSRFDKLS